LIFLHNVTPIQLRRIFSWVTYDMTSKTNIRIPPLAMVFQDGSQVIELAKTIMVSARVSCYRLYMVGAEMGNVGGMGLSYGRA